eukprot:COSAG01_NODE_2138_length_8325_cov_307.344396_1_plen_215_part_10
MYCAAGNAVHMPVALLVLVPLAAVLTAAHAPPAHHRRAGAGTEEEDARAAALYVLHAEGGGHGAGRLEASASRKGMAQLELLPASHLGDSFQHVWEWEMPCVEAQRAVAARWHTTSDVYGQGAWQFNNRGDRSCFPPAGRHSGRCFRAVHEGVFTPSEADRMHAQLQRMPPGQQLRETPLGRNFAQRVARAFAALHGVEGLRISDLSWISDGAPP